MYFVPVIPMLVYFLAGFVVSLFAHHPSLKFHPSLLPARLPALPASQRQRFLLPSLGGSYRGLLSSLRRRESHALSPGTGGAGRVR